MKRSRAGLPGSLLPGCLLCCAALASGCYTATPALVVRLDTKSVNPRQEAIDRKEDERNNVTIRVLCLNRTEKFKDLLQRDLWPLGEEADTLKQLQQKLGDDYVWASAPESLEVRDNKTALKDGKTTMRGVIKPLKKDDKVLKFAHVGITANFANKGGEWKLCLSREELAKYKVVIRSSNLEKKELEPGDQVEAEAKQ